MKLNKAKQEVGYLCFVDYEVVERIATIQKWFIKNTALR